MYIYHMGSNCVNLTQGRNCTFGRSSQLDSFRSKISIVKLTELRLPATRNNNNNNRKQQKLSVGKTSFNFIGNNKRSNYRSPQKKVTRRQQRPESAHLACEEIKGKVQTPPKVQLGTMSLLLSELSELNVTESSAYVQAIQSQQQ